MTRFAFVTPLVLVPLVVTASAAFAQSNEQDAACARDVTRYCRAVMNDNDLVILACLKQHRVKLSKTCEKVLTDNGQ
ncbi:MAG TPA: hypothetical protein VN941_01335 [Bradyrhizobium sp.]|nr:hypothetical protein [Bradyrhizobium sp.]